MYPRDRRTDPQKRAAQARTEALFWRHAEVLALTQRAGVVFDLDGTLADASALDWEQPDPQRLALQLYALKPLEPLLTEALRWEHVPNVDVVYVTGRSQQQWTATRLWLNKWRLVGSLYCNLHNRGPHLAPHELSAWKAAKVHELAVLAQWQHVLVYEDNPANAQAIVANLPPGVGGTSNLAAQAQAQGVPLANHSTLSEVDLANLRLLGKRCCEKGWERLLERPWQSRSQLLDAMQDWVPGRRRRKLFRQQIEDLWRHNP